MKSSALLAVTGILSCILIVGCLQTPRESAPALNPPASSYEISSYELQKTGSIETVRGASVSATFFQVAKVMPLLGRGFLPEEYNPQRQQVALLSQRLWKQQFGAEPRTIGTTVQLNGQTFTVIGNLAGNV